MRSRFGIVRMHEPKSSENLAGCSGRLKRVFTRPSSCSVFRYLLPDGVNATTTRKRRRDTSTKKFDFPASISAIACGCVSIQLVPLRLTPPTLRNCSNGFCLGNLPMHIIWMFAAISTPFMICSLLPHRHTCGKDVRKCCANSSRSTPLNIQYSHEEKWFWGCKALRFKGRLQALCSTSLRTKG